MVRLEIIGLFIFYKYFVYRLESAGQWLMQLSELCKFFKTFRTKN